MSPSLKVISIIFILMLIVVTTFFLNRKKIYIRYSMFLYICFIGLLLCVVFPDLLVNFSNLLGIEVASNFVFASLIGVLFLISIYQIVLISELNNKVRTLIQEVSILKQKRK